MPLILSELQSIAKRNHQLLDMLAQLDDRRTRTATERICAERATHAFPPNAALPADWRRELESLAQELGYRTTKAEEIEAEFVALVRRIAAAPVKRK